MAKLIFNHGCMAAGKTATLLIKEYQFKNNGQEVLVLRPTTDTRASDGFVESRLGLKAQAVGIAPDDNIARKVKHRLSYTDIILVDEVNFFEPDQVEDLAYIVDKWNIQVMCFGLMSDFEGELFPASKRLVELADRLDEQVSMCEIKGCGKKATMHKRLTEDTAKIVCGDGIYKSVCRKCWNGFNIG